MRGKFSKVKPDTDEMVAHVHILFGKKYTSVFFLDEEKNVQDYEIFKTAKRRLSAKNALSRSIFFFHMIYEQLNELANPEKKRSE